MQLKHNRFAALLLMVAVAFTAAPAHAELPASLTRVGALTLEFDETAPSSGVIDSKRGYAYFFTDTSPVIVIKVRLATASSPAAAVARLTLEAGEDNQYYQNAAIDVDGGYIYLATYSTPTGYIVKLKIAEGDAAPTRLGALALDPDEDYLSSIAIDPASGYGFVSQDYQNAYVVKFALGEGDALPTRVDRATLDSQADEGYVYGLVIDPAARRVYAAGYYAFSTLDGGDGNAAPLPLHAVSYFGSAFSASAYYAYFDAMRRQVMTQDYGSDGGPVVMDVSADQARTVGAARPPRTELGSLSGLAVDPYNDVFYAASDNSIPDRVMQWQQAPAGLLPACTFDALGEAGERYLYSALADPVNGFVYFGEQFGNNPGVIVVYQQPVDTSLPKVVSTLDAPKVTSKSGSSRIQVKGSMQNQGTAPVTSFKARAFLSNDRELGYDDQPIGKVINVKTIKAGKSRKVGFKGSFSGPVTGKYVILAPDLEGDAAMQNRATAFVVAGPLP